jgi:hypothetical protein
LDLIQEKVSEIESSYRIQGVKYDECPPVIIKDDKNHDKWIIIEGRKRDEAHNRLGYSHYLYDVLEFTNAWDCDLAMVMLGHDFSPKSPNTITDIEKLFCNAIDQGRFPTCDDHCKNKPQKTLKRYLTAQVELAAADKLPTKRELIVKNVLAHVGTPVNGCKTYHLGTGRASVKTALESVSVDFKGNAKMNDDGDIITARSELDARGTFGAMLLAAAEDGVTVKHYGWIDSPKSNPNPQRQAELKKREAMIRRWEDVIKMSVKVRTNGDDKVVRNKNGEIDLDINFPIEFSGFLPQIMNPDPSKGGEMVETTLVDEYGQPFGA